ncbi:MAG TPA: T9SS type A sorting domain-containing protein [Flavobacteriia bacterium]|nr:T9SS type A sorting domain-containing protein [Flavobacteriia bacterium]
MKSTNTLYTLICSCFLLTTTLYAQNFEWAKAIGGQGVERDPSIAIDALGNSYITGFFIGIADFDPGPNVFNLNSQGGQDIFIVKLDSNGDFIWAKRMGGVGEDISKSIAIDALGNVYTTGYFEDVVDFDSGAGVYNLTSNGVHDIFISKLDTDGNFVWAKRIGGPTSDFGLSIALDASGNVFTTGSFTNTANFHTGGGTFNLTSSGSEDIFISKLNNNGDFIAAIRLGGVSRDIANSITLDDAGNVYTTGFFEGTVDFDPGIGVFNLTSEGDNDIFILKLDASANFIWAKKIGGLAADEAFSIALDATGNIFTTGSFSGAVDFNPGAQLSYRTSAGARDVFILKLDSNGDFIWAKRMGGVGDDNSRSIAIDASGNIYTTGNFEDVVDFDPGAGVYNITSAGFTDIFISKLDISGNFVWANNIGSAGSEYTSFLTLDTSGNIYTTGSFSYTVDFDFGNGIENLTSNGSGDVFIQKLNNSTLSVSNNIFEKSLTVFPNPAQEKSTIELGALYDDITLTIRTLTGQLITTTNYKTTRIINFSIKGSSGLYLAEILADNKRATLKIIKQ